VSVEKKISEYNLVIYNKHANENCLKTPATAYLERHKKIAADAFLVDPLSSQQGVVPP
jgi:hypothetical protein